MKLDTRIKYVIIVVLLLVVLLVPDNWLFGDNYSLCLFKSLFGLECPLCGMTRAVHETSRLNILAAINFNPAVLFLPTLLLAEITNDIYRKPWLKKLRKLFVFGFLLALVLLFIIRLVVFLRQLI